MKPCLAAVLLLLANGCLASSSEPLEWARGDFAGKPGQRVALLAAPTLNGQSCWMQLDTGAHSAVVWHGPEAKPGKSVEVTVSFAGITKTIAASPEMAQRLSTCQTQGVVGTLGNAFFEHGTLTLDLKTPALSFVTGSTLTARSDAQPMFYARWDAVGGHTLVEFHEGNTLRGYALFDTGSTGIGLGVLSSEDWKRATGDAPLSAGGSVRAFSVQAWGKEHHCYMCEDAAKVRVGARPNKTMAVQYCPTLEFKPPLKLAGVVGLQSFQDATVVLDYVAGRWLVEEPR